MHVYARKYVGARVDAYVRAHARASDWKLTRFLMLAWTMVYMYARGSAYTNDFELCTRAPLA